MNDKGFFSNKTQDWALALIKVKMQEAGVKPVPTMLVQLALKATFLYVDDAVVENKVPQEITDRTQKLFDFLIDGKYDEALAEAIDLIPYVMEWLKPKPVEVPALPPKK